MKTNFSFLQQEFAPDVKGAIELKILFEMPSIDKNYEGLKGVFPKKQVDTTFPLEDFEEQFYDDEENWIGDKMSKPIALKYLKKNKHETD